MWRLTERMALVTDLPGYIMHMQIYDDTDDKVMKNKESTPV